MDIQCLSDEYGVRAVAPLATAVDEFMFMAIGASGPEVAISDIEENTGIIRAAPAIVFAGSRATFGFPIAEASAADGV